MGNIARERECCALGPPGPFLGSCQGSGLLSVLYLLPPRSLSVRESTVLKAVCLQHLAFVLSVQPAYPRMLEAVFSTLS